MLYSLRYEIMLYSLRLDMTDCMKEYFRKHIEQTLCWPIFINYFKCHSIVFRRKLTGKNNRQAVNKYFLVFDFPGNILYHYYKQLQLCKRNKEYRTKISLLWRGPFWLNFFLSACTVCAGLQVTRVKCPHFVNIFCCFYCAHVYYLY